MIANLLGKRNAVRRESDKIWKARPFAYVGLLDSLYRVAARALVIAHFPDTFRSLDGLLTARAVAFTTYPTPLEGNRLRELSEFQLPRVLLALAAALPDNRPSHSHPNAPAGFEVHLFVAEHHPLPSFDDRIAEFAAGLPCPSRITFHEALDGALMRRYGGEQAARLMTTLGLPENEFISSPSVDKSIRRAQEKIARRIANPMTADSAEQWFQLNLPERK